MIEFVFCLQVNRILKMHGFNWCLKKNVHAANIQHIKSPYALIPTTNGDMVKLSIELKSRPFDLDLVVLAVMCPLTIDGDYYRTQSLRKEYENENKNTSQHTERQ